MIISNPDSKSKKSIYDKKVIMPVKERSKSKFVMHARNNLNES
jgi:hypothetical protein